MKKALIYGLSLALVFALSACADNQGATISQEQKEPINNEETVADPLSDTEKTPATDEQEPYIVSLDDLPLDLLGAFEYGYSTVHTEYPDLSPEEQMEMELDLIRQWCDSFVIAIPDNLNKVYPEWHAQYEAALNAIDEGTPSTGNNTGTQSGTVNDITPPSNNNGNANSSGSQSSGGNTSKPSTGSSNNGSGTSSGSSNSGSSNSGAPSKEDLEAALGKPATGSQGAPEGVGDGSGTYTGDPEDKYTGIGGTISW